MILFTRTSSTLDQIIMSKFLGFDIKILRKWRSNFSCLIRTPFTRNIWMTNCALGDWVRLWRHYRNYPKPTSLTGSSRPYRAREGRLGENPGNEVCCLILRHRRLTKQQQQQKTKIECAKSLSKTIFQVTRWSFALGKAWSEVIRPNPKRAVSPAGLGCGS